MDNNIIVVSPTRRHCWRLPVFNDGLKGRIWMKQTQSTAPSRPGTGPSFTLWQRPQCILFLGSGACDPLRHKWGFSARRGSRDRQEIVLRQNREGVATSTAPYLWRHKEKGKSWLFRQHTFTNLVTVSPLIKVEVECPKHALKAEDCYFSKIINQARNNMSRSERVSAQNASQVPPQLHWKILVSLNMGTEVCYTFLLSFWDYFKIFWNKIMKLQIGGGEQQQSWINRIEWN